MKVLIKKKYFLLRKLPAIPMQNCRWWAMKNPNFVVDRNDQYSLKSNEWCGFVWNLE